MKKAFYIICIALLLLHCADENGMSDNDVPGFSTTGWKTDFSIHSVPYNEIISGGPPRDGIPPIDDPKFVTPFEADAWLEDTEPLIALKIGDKVKGYPLQILIWHEIVNDNLKDIPLAVTFCPLCYTALVFRRPEIDGELLTFGTSGKLRNSDLIMWDRQTESWWQQFTGDAIIGRLTGTRLERIPSTIMSWRIFKGTYPDAQVLSKNTGFSRRYGSNPYPGYDDVNEKPFLYTGSFDPRLEAMARIIGIETESGESTYITLDRMKREKVIHESLGDTKIVVFWQKGTASAVDTSEIALGKDIGTTSVFIRTLNDRELDFVLDDNDRITDTVTGSIWSTSGKALEGPLKGAELQQIPHHDTFWFAWAAFQ